MLPTQRSAAQPSPAQPSPARSSPARPGPARLRQASPPQAGRERRPNGRRLGRGCRRLPALRHPPQCRTPAAAPRPRALQLRVSWSAPRGPPESSPATNKDSSTTSTAMVPRRQQQCRATQNGPGGRERPPRQQRVTRSGSYRLPQTALSSPPLGQLPPSTPIASYATASRRGIASATSPGGRA